jgi:hypothetical protein
MANAGLVDRLPIGFCAVHGPSRSPHAEYPVGFPPPLLLQWVCHVDLFEHAVPNSVAGLRRRANRAVAGRRRNLARAAGDISSRDRKPLPVQDFYFGPDFYCVATTTRSISPGAFRLPNMSTISAEADDIKFPTKRRAHPRGADGHPDRNRAYVWIALSNFGMS